MPNNETHDNCMFPVSRPLAIQIGLHSRSFTAISTTAPRSYDHEGRTIEYYDGGEYRIVLIDIDIVQRQVARYLSGNHGSAMVEVGRSEEKSCEEWMWKCIFGMEE